MLTLAIPGWDIALRTAAIYLVILIGLRLAGKREIGQMTVFDLEGLDQETLEAALREHGVLT
jgi:hypothetical protein